MTLRLLLPIPHPFSDVPTAKAVRETVVPAVAVEVAQAAPVEVEKAVDKVWFSPLL